MLWRNVDEKLLIFILICERDEMQNDVHINLSLVYFSVFKVHYKIGEVDLFFHSTKTFDLFETLHFENQFQGKTL